MEESRQLFAMAAECSDKIRAFSRRVGLIKAFQCELGDVEGRERGGHTRNESGERQGEQMRSVLKLKTQDTVI